MIEGLSSISDLLRLYKLKERLYLQVADKPAHSDFVQAVVELYSNIFEYQARLICHLSQSPLKRSTSQAIQYRTRPLDGSEQPDNGAYLHHVR